LLCRRENCFVWSSGKSYYSGLRAKVLRQPAPPVVYVAFGVTAKVGLIAAPLLLRGGTVASSGGQQNVVNLKQSSIYERVMPALKMSFPHQLGREAAQERVQARLAQLMERHGDKVSNLRQSWADNVLNFGFTTYGFAIQGNATVEENDVRLDAQIPFAAMMFKGKIEQTMREQMAKILQV
jgi:hypothetical protein